MTTIQVMPHEVRQGDRITINAKVEFIGEPFYLNGRRLIVLCYNTDTSLRSRHYVNPDQPLTVDRPDPDADLIEAMARAIVDSDVLDWDELTERDMLGYRANVRSALAALREYEAGA